jgi:hypothetical protein
MLQPSIISTYYQENRKCKRLALTLKKQRSTIEAEISAPKPPVTGAS